jgi:hypothetical protein
MSDETIPEVFLIESLRRREETHRCEGEALCNILRMMRKKPKYAYIRTAKELALMAQEFARARYRYLHLSCHGNEEEFALTLDDVPFVEFAKIFDGVLQRKRLFLSVCSAAQPALARELFRTYATSPYSLTGPSEPIGFSTAAAMWASLYNLLFREQATAVESEHLKNHLKALCKLNGVEFVHFGRIKSPPYYKEWQRPATLMQRTR